MESAQPEIWTLFPQSAAAPAALGALASSLETPRETQILNLVSARTDIRSRSPR